MALIASAAALGFAPTLSVHHAAQRADVRMESRADLEVLAKELNPVVGFWDPMGLTADYTGNSFMGQYGAEGAIAFLRHAEIKHGRVAMAAFVGFIVQSNGIHFPWATTLSGMTYADIAAAGSPAAQWDAVPTAAKMQIFGLIFLLEAWGEYAVGDAHYMKGGKPGLYPSFAPIKESLGHPVFDLFDPFGFSKKASAERKAKGLKAEINNGRLAMLGIMGFVSAASVEGSVPALAGKIAHYDGEVMAPFSASDAALPYVSQMLNFPHLDSWSKAFFFAQ